MSKDLEFTLNGQAVRVEDCSPNTTLLEYLRNSGRTGSKEGCAEGDCGACSVVIVDHDSKGKTCYRAINSCLVPLCLMAGREIISVEGVACGGKLHPVQEKMIECHGSQCGYCTPGFVMSLFAEHYRPGRAGPCDPHELGGNLCRCTGYRPILDAALSLGAAPSGDFLDRLSRPAPRLEAIEYESADARFSRPGDLEKCLSILAADPEAARGRLDERFLSQGPGWPPRDDSTEAHSAQRGRREPPCGSPRSRSWP